MSRFCNLVCKPTVVCAGCFISQQQVNVPQEQICQDKGTCCHTETEAAGQIYHFTQGQHIHNGPTSPNPDPINARVPGRVATRMPISSSSSAFDVMVALTRSSLPWVPHTWISGPNPLQTPKAWFWGTHEWAIFAALLADGVSRTVGNVLVFGPPLHRGIEWRSLRQSSWDGDSVCSGLFWGERWWSVGVMAAERVRPGLGCILQSCRGWLSSYDG